MVGVTIDHIISLTVLVAAVMLAMGLYSQILSTALSYQRYQQIVIKAEDLINNLLLTPGYPRDWGQRDDLPAAFGLQHPEAEGYTLSSFSLMRLLSSSGEKVYYNITGKWYSNVSWGLNGGYLLISTSDCINYTTASKLLGINETYGFQLTITPTLSINISEVRLDPLELNIEVRGPGFPLSQARLDYLLFWTVGKANGGWPLFNFTSGSAETNSTGLARLEFSSDPYINVNNNQTAYTILVNANLGGLRGVGYKSRETLTGAGNIIPFVENYGNGTVLLAHKWGKNDPDGNQGALHFNATFYLLPHNFVPIKVYIENSTGLVNYGKGGKPYHKIQIPTFNAGFLIVSYCKGNEYGMVVMPWGTHTMGVSITFGGDPSGREWVATSLRQVTVGQISYQVKLALWSLTSG